MTLIQLVAFYKEAEKRALDSTGGTKGQGGKAFLKDDRYTLIKGMLDGGVSKAQLALAISGYDSQHPSYSQAFGRIRVFQEQAARGDFRLGSQQVKHPEPRGRLEISGRLTPALLAPIEEQPFDGRIKTRADIQPAFNRACEQLARLGITNVAEAQSYLANGFEVLRVNQKVEASAERVLRELQIGQLTKEQVLAVLDKVKAKI